MKLLIKKLVPPKKDCIQIFILFLLLSTSVYGQRSNLINFKVSLGDVFSYELIKDIHDQVMMSKDSILNYKDSAIFYSNANDEDKAVTFINKYLKATGDMSIISDHLFENIKETPQYLDLKEKYRTKLDVISIIYIYGGFFGIFIFLVLSFKKDVDRVSTMLIALFVLFNSLFILHLSLYRINYQYYIPHTLLATTTFSFLYGPLLYFYFKRTIKDYKFKPIDLLHLVPSAFLLVYVLPFYLLPRLEKFNILLNGELKIAGANMVIIGKIISLFLYAFLVYRMHKQYKEKLSNEKHHKPRLMWQRNMITLFGVYAVAYIFYAAGITKIIPMGFVFHFQILVQIGVVFYVAYIAYEQPEIFKGKVKLMVDPVELFKYKKSGLTPALSLELKDNLLRLLNEQKVYRENNMNLDLLAEMLGTTRHNTSQVINEHFKMSFSELMNQYRIKEAAEILKNDQYNSLSIIQVAYEVGFNNKVSFNKSFKKKFSQTPSEYIKSFRP